MPYLLNQHQTITLDIQPSQEIGAGGMGVVYRIGNLFGNGNLVAKIFKNPKDPKNPSKAKLQAMLNRPPEHVYEVINGVGYTQFAWVQYLIFEDDGSLVGYAMPELDFDRSLSLNPFMYPREAERLTDYQKSLNYRVQLCANISALMADLHAHGHAFIDFKEQNLRLLPEPKTGINDDFKGFIVGFVDCDSFRVTGQDGTVYPSPVISPEMTSPEYHEHKDISLLDEKHDRFVLAIELFKILNYGIHPFYFIPLSDRLKNLSHRDTDQFIKERLYAYGLNSHSEIAPLKASIHACWDDATRVMFDKAFLSTDPNDRPTAEQWEDHLRGLLNGRQFVICENFPNDASHIHFVGKPCHRCLTLQKQQNFANNAILDKGNIANPNTPAQPVQHSTVPPTTANPWLTVPNHVATPIQPNTNDEAMPTPVIADTDALAKNRDYEKSLSGQSSTISQASVNSTISIPVAPVEVVNTEPHPQTETLQQTATQVVNETPTSNQPVEPTPVNSPNDANVSSNKSNKWLAIPLALGVIAVGGYGLSKMGKNDPPTPNPDNKGNVVTVTADPNAYKSITNELPQAKQQINDGLAKVGVMDNTATAKTISDKQGEQLYADTLDLDPKFFEAVREVAQQGEPNLNGLQQVAFSQNIDETKSLALGSFRDADMRYFAKMPVNKDLAKQLNESAKIYYWKKKDPKSALYLQAQAVKNSPNQGEYVANLAFYLVKNNYPFAKDFVLYALQTPRDSNKFPNTYMIELASAMAVKQGDEQGAIGALLAQYYTADDKAKRCQNMLKYPQTYPELVPIAEKAFVVIDEQNNDGVAVAPEACLPPLNWAN
ncbi:MULTISPECIES: hypothetical protein [unclassified Moraxella]|uniref:hypothetical protein n=1 Tax=unclassified Moraxella TaxID=2685852 RepID=UPI003AF55FC3